MQSEAVEKLVAAYRHIAEEQMRSLPLYNDRLSVEPVDFHSWQGRSLGILITPWFMNLVLLPAEDDEWSGWNPGETAQWEFPSGTYEFNASRTGGSQTYLSAALFSTVQDFPDQETARAVAERILTDLFHQAPKEESVATNAPSRQLVSRRDLFGKLLLIK